MTITKTYYLFISHAWRYHDDYDRLVNLLNVAQVADPGFAWHNYSSPLHNPAVDPDTEVGGRALRRELEQQIRPTSCVLIISGMYVPYSYWIQTEIDIAQSYSKPSVGIRPRGQERVPLVVQQASNEMVGWDTSSIVAAIKRWAL